MILVRQEIGDVLRDFRLQKGRTLRQVAGKASRCSLMSFRTTWSRPSNPNSHCTDLRLLG